MQKRIESPKTKILQYVIAIAIGALVSFLVACLFGLFTDWQVLRDKSPGWSWRFYDTYTKNMFVLTNGIFVSGVLCFCFGMLCILSNGGAFDFIVYGIKRFISLFKKDPSDVRFKTYYDYKMYRDGTPKSSFLYMVLVGLLYVGVSMIFLLLWKNGIAPFEQ